MRLLKGVATGSDDDAEVLHDEAAIVGAPADAIVHMRKVQAPALLHIIITLSIIVITVVVIVIVFVIMFMIIIVVVIVNIIVIIIFLNCCYEICFTSIWL